MGLGFQEMLIVGVIAILLFGKNLPDVARTMGKYYRDFRKGLNDLHSQIDFNDSYNSTPARAKPRKTYAEDDYEDVSAPRFVPPPEEPPVDPPQSLAS
jgi:sec-independent protein translocase protein TatA